MSGVSVTVELVQRGRHCHHCGRTIPPGERCLAATQWRTNANICRECMGNLFSRVLDIPVEELWNKLNR